VIADTSDPLPAYTTTVQAHPATIEASSISVKDISVVLAICVALTIIVGFFFNRASIKRKEDRDDALARTQQIMDALKISSDNAARDTRELSDKVKDGRTVLEKDLDQVRSVMRHDIANVKTQMQSLEHFGDKNADEIVKLRDRMTAAETNSKHQTDALNKLETTVSKSHTEMKELIKSQGDASTKQFEQLAVSLREARDAKLKG